jgi:hypothetical protein
MTSRVAAVLLFALAACADFERGPATPKPDASAPADGGADGAAVSFAADVDPLLVAGCQRCHAEGQQAGDTSFLLPGEPTADYVAASRLVDVARPEGSRLLAKMSGVSHDGGTVYGATTPEYQTILAWIREGARP